MYYAQIGGIGGTKLYELGLVSCVCFCVVKNWHYIDTWALRRSANKNYNEKSVQVNLHSLN
mgnify:FL=1